MSLTERQFQQLSEQIAALRDGLIKRVDEQGAKLDMLSGQIRSLSESQNQQHTFIGNALREQIRELGETVHDKIIPALLAAAPKQKQRPAPGSLVGKSQRKGRRK